MHQQPITKCSCPWLRACSLRRSSAHSLRAAAAAWLLAWMACRSRRRALLPPRALPRLSMAATQVRLAWVCPLVIYRDTLV
jgi:hypothetical protein